jgi:hypothetical protein
MKQDDNVHVFDFRSIIDPDQIKAAGFTNVFKLGN